jgi:hypothetical protein
MSQKTIKKKHRVKPNIPQTHPQQTASDSPSFACTLTSNVGDTVSTDDESTLLQLEEAWDYSHLGFADYDLHY